jgi:hypothetical protein
VAIIFFSIYGDFGDLSEKLFGHVHELMVVMVQSISAAKQRDGDAQWVPYFWSLVSLD